MNRRSLLLVLVLCLGVGDLTAQTLWEWNYPKPQGNSLRGLILKTDALGVAFGDAGTVMRRSGGAFLSPQYPIDLAVRAGGYHIDTMWIVGDSGHIFRSTNNGTSWVSQRYSAQHIRFDGVQVKDKNTLWVVGDSGYILYSTSAGASFTKQNNTYKKRLHDVGFAKENVYACGDSGTLLRGASFGGAGYARFPTGKPFAFHALDMDTTNIFVVGDSGYILRRTFFDEAFVTDTNLASPVVGRSITFNDVAYYDNIVIAVGSDGTIKRSVDTGWTWTTPASQTVEHLNQIRFASDFSTSGIAWIVGDGGAFLRSTNFGSTWVRLDSGTRQITYAAGRTPLGVLYVTSAAGIVFRSTNDGASWRRDSLSNIGARLMDIAFDDNGFGLISTYDNKVLRSVDTGKTWSPVTMGATGTLILGVTLQGNLGLACGTNGQMFRSTNRGSIWTSVTTNTTRSLYDVEVFGMYAIAAGDNGVIIYSVDQGKTWSALTQGTTRYNRVQFATAENAVAVGQSGTIVRTTDHGQHWSAVSTSVIEHLNDVRFHDDRNGIVVGDKGTILKTTNAGASWYFDKSHTINDLKGAIVINGTDAYVAGNRTTILYTTNSALPVELLSFRGKRQSDGTVALDWKVARESNNSGFSIDRSADGLWSEIGFVRGAGTTDAPRSYYHLDPEAPTREVSYRIRQRDLDGSEHMLGTVELGAVTDVESDIAIAPNPTADKVSITFEASAHDEVRITIVNTLGVEVAVLADREFGAGSHTVSASLRQLAPGSYRVIVDRSSGRSTKNLVIE